MGGAGAGGVSNVLALGNLTSVERVLATGRERRVTLTGASTVATGTLTSADRSLLFSGVTTEIVDAAATGAGVNGLKTIGCKGVSAFVTEDGGDALLQNNSAVNPPATTTNNTIARSRNRALTDVMRVMNADPALNCRGAS